MKSTQNINSDDLLKQLQVESDLHKKRKLENDLWVALKNEGTPIISEKKSTCDVTFIYQSKTAKTVELACEDLRDRLLDLEGNPKKFTKILGTDTFILQVTDIPKNAFVPYSIKCDDSKLIISNPFNSNSLSIYEYATVTVTLRHVCVSYFCET